MPASLKTASHFARGTMFLIAMAICSAALAEERTHLFILSGQSNMGGLKPEESFTPTVTEAFPKDRIIVVKWAKAGESIARWYKDWKDSDSGNKHTRPIGDLYDKTMAKVHQQLGATEFDTVTFVWMQGEKDAKNRNSEVYASSLAGLVQQLRADLKRDDLNFVVGRITDWSGAPKTHWEGVRAAQVKVAEADARGAWVDTDDLNGPEDKLHFTRDGYVELGKRFAVKAAELINAPPAANAN